MLDENQNVISHHISGNLFTAVRLLSDYQSNTWHNVLVKSFRRSACWLNVTFSLVTLCFPALSLGELAISIQTWTWCWPSLFLRKKVKHLPKCSMFYTFLCFIWSVYLEQGIHRKPKTISVWFYVFCLCLRFFDILSVIIETLNPLYCFFFLFLFFKVVIWWSHCIWYVINPQLEYRLHWSWCCCLTWSMIWSQLCR